MSNPLVLSICVGIGGFFGSLLRYGFQMASYHLSFTWPLGTLTSNVLGCFVIGVLAGLTDRGINLQPELRLALVTGFCGGFTTMSTLVYETSEMMRSSDYFQGALYLTGTFLLSFLSFAIGFFAIRLLVRAGDGSS